MILPSASFILFRKPDAFDRAIRCRIGSLSVVDLNMAPEFEGGIYNGTGIVQDGNIITSGVCPLWSREKELKDGTSELTQALIEAIKTKQ